MASGANLTFGSVNLADRRLGASITAILRSLTPLLYNRVFWPRRNRQFLPHGNCKVFPDFERSTNAFARAAAL